MGHWLLGTWIWQSREQATQLHQTGDQLFATTILHTKQDGGYRQQCAKLHPSPGSCETLSDSAQIHLLKGPGLLGDNTSHGSVMLNSSALHIDALLTAWALYTWWISHSVSCSENVSSLQCWLFSSQSCFSEVTFTYQKHFFVLFRDIL